MGANITDANQFTLYLDSYNLAIHDDAQSNIHVTPPLYPPTPLITLC